MGLTPASRYNRIVSWEARARSRPELVWISRNLGARAVIARIWLICFKVRGNVTSRTSAVKAMMAIPIWLKRTTYNTIRVLSMGRMINSVQKKPNASKEPYLTSDQLSAPNRPPREGWGS